MPDPDLEERIRRTVDAYWAQEEKVRNLKATLALEEHVLERMKLSNERIQPLAQALHELDRLA